MKAGLMECDCNKIEQSVIENLAPIVLFTYNRVQHTMKTVEALKKIFMHKKVIFIFFRMRLKIKNKLRKLKKLELI